MARTAVVTGASGYAATEIVKQLLEKGYDVRGTVRSVSSKEKVQHLELLGRALPGNLTLCEGDLLKPGQMRFPKPGRWVGAVSKKLFQCSSRQPACTILLSKF